MSRDVTGQFFGVLDVPEAAATAMLKSPQTTFIIPAAGTAPCDGVISRFLSKIAIEVMASRLLAARCGIDGFIDGAQLDSMRNHARRGTTPQWLFCMRRINGQNERFIELTGHPSQILHEYDVLATECGEWFLVLAIFGISFAINYGGD